MWQAFDVRCIISVARYDTVVQLVQQALCLHNGLIFFPSGAALRDCVKLETLHLQNNRLSLLDGLQTLAQLKSLHLESNRIPSIVNLNCNKNLTHLDLSRNQIRKIQVFAAVWGHPPSMH